MAPFSRTRPLFLHGLSSLKKWSGDHLTTFFYSYIGTTAKYVGYPTIKWSHHWVDVSIWLIWLRMVGQETSITGRPKIKRVKIAIRRRHTSAWRTTWAAQGQGGKKKNTQRQNRVLPVSPQSMHASLPYCNQGWDKHQSRSWDFTVSICWLFDALVLKCPLDVIILAQHQ